MKLGHSFEIAQACEDPRSAVQFYRQHGWQSVEARLHVGGVRMTDGFIFISLEPGKSGTTKIRYFAETLGSLDDKLKEAGIKTSGDDGMKHFVDPNGLEIELVASAKKDKIEAKGVAVSKFGQFGELSIESDDMKRSFAFWRKLGFGPTQYNPDPVISWASLTDGMLNLGIYAKGHCKHVFRGAVITYFNEDMASRISSLKQEGVRFTQELETGENTRNAVLEAPHKQMFFLFSV